MYRPLTEGEEGSSIFILTEGSVQIKKRLGLGALMPDDSNMEKLLVILDAPQFFGDMGLLENTERSATVTPTLSHRSQPKLLGC